jgi:hypothetical protein
METLEEFYQSIRDIFSEKIEYSILFEPDTGRIIGVGPTLAFHDRNNRIVVDEDIAIDMLLSKISMSKFMVDIETEELKLVELKTLIKIDDVLHRLNEKKFSQEMFFDLYVICDIKNKTIKIELTEELKGTRKLEEGRSFRNRNIRWDGQTNMNFYLTEYNDPNVLYEILCVKVSDLVEKSMIFKNIDFPKNFSVYTRRLFKKYILEIV